MTKAYTSTLPDISSILHGTYSPFKICSFQIDPAAPFSKIPPYKPLPNGLWKGLALQLPEQMMKAQMAKHTMFF